MFLLTAVEGFGITFNNPIGPPQQIREISHAKPFRHLILGILFKNFTLEDSITSACSIIDHIFLAPCTYPDHLRTTLSQCDPRTNERLIQYSWAMYNETHMWCRDDYHILPMPESIPCPYISRRSSSGMALCIVSLTGIVACLVVGMLVRIYKSHRVIKSASPFFCQISLAGLL